MTYISQMDWLIEIQKGNVSGHSIVHKFGRNDTIPNGSWAMVNQLAFTSWPLTAETTVRIKSGGNAADDSTGLGAQTVEVEGVDGAGALQEALLTTAGTSASAASSKGFMRVYRARVATTGTYNGANTGDIVIENSAGGTDLIKVTAAEGQTQFAGYTIPLAKTGYLLGVHIHVSSNKQARARVMTLADFNDVTPPVASNRIRLQFDGVAGPMSYTPRSPEITLPALTDIWVEGYGDGGTAEMIADFEILLVDD